MNSRIFKTFAAFVVAVGLTTASVAAPAEAAILKKSTSGPTTHDTGWGFK